MDERNKLVLLNSNFFKILIVVWYFCLGILFYFSYVNLEVYLVKQEKKEISNHNNEKGQTLMIWNGHYILKKKSMFFMW
jgi:hypothetical protein